MTNVIAIDFGTMRTKLAYIDSSRNKPEIMRLGTDDKPYIPSIFYLGKDGKRLFGDAASDFLEADPIGFLRRPLKRDLREPWVRAGNREKATPTELLTLLIAGLRERAKALPVFHKQIPSSLYLTIPVQYGPPDERVLLEAAHRAGFDEGMVHFVKEPVSAAQAWLSELGGAEEFVVVLDCGGGTLDWACLYKIKSGEFEIVVDPPPGGDNKVGGYNIDDTIYELIKDSIVDEVILKELEERSSYVRDQIRVIKEKYSRGGVGGRIKLSGTTIEIDQSDISETIQNRFINQVCDNFGPYLSKVKDKLKISNPSVLLVGGSSRIMGLKESLQEREKCNPIWWERSDYATVLGALPIDIKSTVTTRKSGINEGSIDTKNQEFIDKHYRSATDFRFFVREALFVAYRLNNIIHISSYNCDQKLSSIQPDESKKSISLKVRQGLESFHFIEYDELVENITNELIQSAVEFVQTEPLKYINYFRGLEDYRSKVEIVDTWKQDIKNSIQNDMLKIKNDYVAIKKQYNQLCEHYPRYDSIMNRSIWGDIVAGGALRFFTGGLGVAGAALWGGWKSMDDDKFGKYYDQALYEFIQSCFDFSKKNEDIIEKYIQDVIDYYDTSIKHQHEMFKLLSEYGEILEEIHKRIKNGDDDLKALKSSTTHEYFATVVNNLKEKKDITLTTLQNIIDELIDSGIMLTASGDLDEEALNKLPASDSDMLFNILVDDIYKIIDDSGMKYCESFYLNPEIPENKLINALKSYGHGLDYSHIIALYDDTFFGGAAQGFMITLDGIFSSDCPLIGWIDMKKIVKPREDNAIKINAENINLTNAATYKNEVSKMFTGIRDRIIKYNDDIKKIGT